MKKLMHVVLYCTIAFLFTQEIQANENLLCNWGNGDKAPYWICSTEKTAVGVGESKIEALVAALEVLVDKIEPYKEAPSQLKSASDTDAAYKQITSHSFGNVKFSKMVKVATNKPISNTAIISFSKESCEIEIKRNRASVNGQIKENYTSISRKSCSLNRLFQALENAGVKVYEETTAPNGNIFILLGYKALGKTSGM